MAKTLDKPTLRAFRADLDTALLSDGLATTLPRRIQMGLPEDCDFEPKTCPEAYLQQEMMKALNQNMTGKDRDIAKVKALGHGDNCTVFWHEEGGGEVYRVWDMLFLFEIPQYGGEGRYAGSFDLDGVEQLVDLAHTWT